MSNYNPTPVSEALTKERNGEVDAPCFELCTFRDRLGGLMRGLQFIHRDKSSVYVAMEGHPYTLGWIGWKDYQDTTDDNFYAVCSHNIENEKYGDYRIEHHMKLSRNMDTALRNAKKFLRPHTPSQLVSMSRGVLSNHIGRVRSVADSRQRESYSDINNDSLMRELRHLVDTGHKFIDDSIHNKLVTYFTAVDEAKELKAKQVNVWFVRVFERMGKQMFETVAIDNAENHWKQVISEVVDRYNADTLPEEIMGKLSVLNMLGDDEYVEDVGLKLGEGMFYVLR